MKCMEELLYAADVLCNSCVTESIKVLSNFYLWTYCFASFVHKLLSPVVN